MSIQKFYIAVCKLEASYSFVSMDLWLKNIIHLRIYTKILAHKEFLIIYCASTGTKLWAGCKQFYTYSKEKETTYFVHCAINHQGGVWLETDQALSLLHVHLFWWSPAVAVGSAAPSHFPFYYCPVKYIRNLTYRFVSKPVIRIFHAACDTQDKLNCNNSNKKKMYRCRCEQHIIVK